MKLFLLRRLLGLAMIGSGLFQIFGIKISWNLIVAKMIAREKYGRIKKWK